MINPHSFLIENLNTVKVKHGDKTFYDHLCNVEKILRICGCDEDVCIAGLYHSIYGTSNFEKQTINDRKKIQDVIGIRAENLVYIFCNASRPFCWFFGRNIPLRNGTYTQVDDQTLLDLQLIETANLLDQRSKSVCAHILSTISNSNAETIPTLFPNSINIEPQPE